MPDDHVRLDPDCMIRLACLLLLPLACHAQGEWVTLFDGKDAGSFVAVTGKPFPATWAVRDGCLATVPQSGGFQDIRTRETYRSFELEWEWIVSKGGNSGVKYFVTRETEWPHPSGTGMNARGRGLEYQMADDQNAPEAVGDPMKRSGALYGRIAPIPGTSLPAGAVNRSRLVVRGGHVEHWLNGVKVAQHDSEIIESPIVFQHHNSEVCFRSIRIHVLP